MRSSLSDARPHARILVVDDDAQERALLDDTLSDRGFEVVTVGDGGAAVRKAEEFAPDLILLDLSLPVLDGFEVLEEIKKRKVATRVIMFSGVYMSLDVAVKCIKSGACDFLTKPTDLQDLINHIERNLITESAINLNVANPAPIIGELLALVEDFTKENSRLRSQLEGGSVLLKLAYLALSVATCVLLFRLGIITTGVSIVMLLLALFLLMLIPFRRIKEISGKANEFAGKISLRE